MKRISIALLLCGGCQLGSVESVHGDVSSLASESLAREKAAERDDPEPLVVKVERNGIRGVDPATNETIWFHAVPVVGHLAANKYMVAATVRGSRVVAIDRRTGEVHWEQKLPGEAVTGLSVSWRWVAATTTGGEGEDANQLLLMGAGDGGIRWMHGSTESFGVPAVFGKVVMVAHQGQLLAVGTMFGRELARQDLPQPLDRHARAVRVGDDARIGVDGAWIDLTSFGKPVELTDLYSAVYSPSYPVDPGYDEGARLKWVVVPGQGNSPTKAVAMMRRAVIGVELSPSGAPVRARWAHLAAQDEEYVAIEVANNRVHLVNERGDFVALSDNDGRQVVHAPGSRAVRGALLLDVGKTTVRGAPGSSSELELVHELADKLAALIGDEDPRLLPAQRLAVDLLHRGMGDAGKRHLIALVSGTTRNAGDDASVAVRSHALTHLESGGFSGSLSARPGEGEGHGPVQGLTLLARRAAASADKSAVPDLLAHLIHPSTPAAALGEVASALCTLDTAPAREGLADFVRRYHADREAVLESSALQVSVDCLTDQKDLATNSLHAIVDDPFTDPGLRAYIRAALPQGPTVFAQGPAGSDDGDE